MVWFQNFSGTKLLTGEKMKKIGTIMLMFFILICLNSKVFAAEQMTVFSEDIAFVEEEALRIPIMIKDNSGIMGFKIHIEYPKEEITILGTESGEITKQGSLSDNAEVAKGSMDVLWTGTSDSVGDGVLFYVLIKPQKAIQSDVILKVSYSQGDTFNENWEDVVLDCKNITLLAQQEVGINNTNTEYVVENAEKYVEEKAIAEFVEDAGCSLDTADVRTLIEKKLEKNEISSFQDSNIKATEKAADSVLSALEKDGITIAATIKTYEPEQKIEAVETLYTQLCDEADEVTEKEKTQKAKKKSKNNESIKEQNTWVQPLIGILLCVGVVTVIFYKKKNHGRENK